MHTSHLMKVTDLRTKAIRLTVLFLALAVTAAAGLAQADSIHRVNRVVVKERVAVVPVEPVPATRVEVVPVENFSAAIWTDRTSYRNGDFLNIQFRVSRSSYVYIFDTDTEGVTRQIFPNYYDQDNYIAGGKTVSLPTDTYAFKVTGPAGTERLEIVAVTEDYPVLTNYKGFSRSNPYPERSGGAQKFVNEVKVDAGRLRSDTVTHTETRVAGSIGIRPNRVDVVAKSVDVVPVPEPVGIARADVFFTVRPAPYIPVRVGRLKISSSPSQADVYIDGRYEGRTPEEVILPYGRHEVRLHRVGFFEEVFNVDINHPGKQKISVRLEEF